MANKTLELARARKNDEFYTKYEDIENELKYYKKFFINQAIYCPCDTNESNFFKFFLNNFKEFQLIKLCASSLHQGVNIYSGVGSIQFQTNLNDNDGNILQEEVQSRMQHYDIICTNPPFSLLKDFISILMSLNKKFIILYG